MPNPKSFIHITYFFLFLFCFSPLGLQATHRASSYPYISGDTFRHFADHIFDEENQHLHVRKIKHGDVIFVKTDFLESFFHHYHPKIPCQYILLSHNGDLPVPRGLEKYLSSKKLLAWFSANVANYQHEKLIPIPIGLANSRWPHGNTESIEKAISLKNFFPRDILLYRNFRKSTHQSRNQVFNLFTGKSFVYTPPILPFEKYLEDLLRTKFVLSPRGNGLDCHRTWEALYLGAIPVVKKSSLDPLLKDLPVMLINSWSDVTPDRLQEEWKKQSKRTYSHEKLFAEYWFDLINQKRQNSL